MRLTGNTHHLGADFAHDGVDLHTARVGVESLDLILGDCPLLLRIRSQGSIQLCLGVLALQLAILAFASARLASAASFAEFASVSPSSAKMRAAFSFS